MRFQLVNVRGHQLSPPWHQHLTEASLRPQMGIEPAVGGGRSIVARIPDSFAVHMKALTYEGSLLAKQLRRLDPEDPACWHVAGRHRDQQ